MKTVAILGSIADEHSQYVAQAVTDVGGQAWIVETSRVPEHSTLSWHDGEVWSDGRPLHECRCFYLKAIHLSLPTHDPQAFSHRNFEIWHEQYAAERERHSFLASIFRCLHAEERCFVNPIETFDLHFLKLFQLSLLRSQQIPVPASLATSDPNAVMAFVEQYPSVIYKPLSGGALVRRFSVRDQTPERLQLLRNAPVLFQEEVKGEEFRAYVLDGEPVAAVQIPTEGVVDAREALEHARPATLPTEAWELAIRTAQTLGVIFGAVDMRLSTDGRWVILECNPTPAITYFDTHDKLIVSRLAAYLLEHA